MNTNPNAKRILCFGDSNTYGRVPGPERLRFPANVRWTGVLQNSLGEDYEVIEEGLGGRNTMIEDPENLDRNGLNYLLPCIESHIPIDFLVVCLGTNDLKEKYDLSAEQIASNLDKLLQRALERFQENQSFQPEVIVMSPPLVDESVETTQERYKGAEAKSKLLGSLYSKVAEKHQAKFIDLSVLVQPSKGDGYHLDADAQTKVAQELASLITGQYPNAN